MMSFDTPYVRVELWEIPNGKEDYRAAKLAGIGALPLPVMKVTDNPDESTPPSEGEFTEVACVIHGGRLLQWLPTWDKPDLPVVDFLLRWEPTKESLPEHGMPQGTLVIHAAAGRNFNGGMSARWFLVLRA